MSVCSLDVNISIFKIRRIQTQVKCYVQDHTGIKKKKNCCQDNTQVFSITQHRLLLFGISERIPSIERTMRGKNLEMEQ